MPRASSRMRQSVTLQELIEGYDPDYGSPLNLWQDGPVLAASFEPLKGGEYWRGQNMPQLSAQVDARVRVRFRKGLRPDKHRLRHGGIIYAIKSVIHVRQRNETELMVTASAEQQDDGGTVNV